MDQWPFKTILLHLTLLLLAVLLYLWVGPVWFNPIKGIFHPSLVPAGVIIWHERIPRLILAIISGAGLSMAGVSFQVLLRNPLADPYIVGVSGGAAIGGVLGMLLLPSIWFAVPIFAILCAFAITLVLFKLSIGPGRINVLYLLLAGVVFNSFAGAMIMILRVILAPRRSLEVLSWLMGSLSIFHPDYLILLLLLSLTIAAFFLLFYYSRAMDALSLGQQEAMVLGINALSVTRILFLTASFITSIIVSFTGLIGFVGLIVPHAIRLIYGPSHRKLLPLAAILGATFVVLSDMLVRLAFVFTNSELPVGALTALIGGPMFVYLLYRTNLKI